MTVTPFHRNALLVLAVLLGALGYAIFVWPTPYVIVHEKGSVFRVNRFTGIREDSTERGWMTRAQVETLRKTNLEQKATEDRARSQQILEELKQIDIYNPTNWELSRGARVRQDTVIEYFRNDGNTERFVCKVESDNYFIKAGTHNDFTLTGSYTYGVPREISDLAGGTSFVQKVTITFGTAMSTKGGTKEYVELDPPFVLRYQRPWIASAPRTEEAP
jgi:hypothetical protein